MKKFIALLLSTISLITCFAFGCKNPAPQDISFYAPDGAPALTIAKLMANNDTLGCESVNYNVVSSEEIGAQMTRGNADLIILPVNQASVSYNVKGDPYKLVAVITHGNLYLASKTAISDLTVLKGRVVGIAGNENQVPDLTLKAILKSNGIGYERVDNNQSPSANNVGLYYSAPQNIKEKLGADHIYAGLLPEPAISMGNTAQMNRLALHSLFDSESNSFPQAVLMAKSSVLANNPNLVSTLKQKMSDSFNFAVENAPQAIATITSVYPATTLKPAMTGEMFARCSIAWQDANDAKESVKNYLLKIKDVSSVCLGIEVAAEVTDEFFYI